MAAGRAIVSTLSLCAEEVLAEGRGCPSRLRMAPPLRKGPLRFLSHTEFRVETRRRAYEYARPMFWPNVGRKYLDLFSRIVSADRERQEAHALTHAYWRDSTAATSSALLETAPGFQPLSPNTAEGVIEGNV